MPPQADPEKARAAVAVALAAWEKGEAPEALSKRSPPIYFTDTHWQKGYRLTHHKIEKDEPYGRSVKLTVRLFLDDGKGKSQERRAIYTADTDPAIVIVPEGF